MGEQKSLRLQPPITTICSSNKFEPTMDEDKGSNWSPSSVLTYAATPQLTLSKIRSSKSLPVIVAVRHGRTKNGPCLFKKFRRRGTKEKEDERPCRN
ncbi:hypothetical protein EV2_006405 [Malus domestica]